MLGWFSEAISRASRLKRSVNCSADTLIATISTGGRAQEALRHESILEGSAWLTAGIQPETALISQLVNRGKSE